MIRLLIICIGLFSQPTFSWAGEKVVSLDHCADQYVLEFVDRDNILAVSKRATDDYALHRDRAEGIPTVQPSLEDVLLLKPDLVVRTYGGEPGLSSALERFGIRVINVPWAADLDGVARAVETVGKAIGTENSAAEYAAALSAHGSPRPSAEAPSALYLTPSGVTAGPNTMMHEVILASGFSNFTTQPGWHDISLEHLIKAQPDFVIRGFFDTKQQFDGNWSIGRHPLLARQLEGIPYTDLKSAWISCDSWAVLNAINHLQSVYQ
ncbi:MAG: ABC transporter substrate-binding protein [Pseudomonadota bacterium]